ncbi:MAG: chitinase C-terminal domain-containing protein [Alkalimonas sp.]|nr:chitinase C-terminal domain-containing protein [Alkalimonas sp.]
MRRSASSGLTPWYDPVDPVDPVDPIDPVDPVEPHPGDTPCRPDGLYQTPGLEVPYCSIYDELGIEIISPDHPRRIIGYFTSWRHGKNDQPAYLASDIPWSKITHINYAFAHVDSNHRISVGDVTDPNNSSTGMSWPDVPGAELDPNLPYQGHFNLLNRYKAEHPHVKTLIAVGGWAETGGYFDANGDRIASGGFYSMTTNPDGSINHAGIHTFAESAVAFLRQYQFDGLDIDYEYPTSMTDAGNPDDFHISNPLRGSLNASFVELMRVLRQYLDAASVEDGVHYQLTMAVPSSAYLLRGMEVFDALQYLDFINVMSYDLHGSWNQFVGPNAALFDTGEDAELVAWNYYNAAQYQQLGYLNTDWAFHYYRGALPAGRINIGIPYYSRGWQRVQGGHHGLWGTASLPDQSQCPPGTGGSTVSRCGDGAVGIDNLWHDLDTQGEEIPAGSNPLWHLRNLQQGIVGSYLEDYGLDPATNPAHQLIGSYQHHYEPVAVAPWLWNDEKKVFLSIEDELSIATKAQYVIDQQIGGVMFWELAGDYSWHSDRGEYFFGDTLTSIFYHSFQSAPPYGHLRSELPLSEQAIDLRFTIDNFKLGDQNFPINPTLTLTNHSAFTIPGGSRISFSVPTAIPDSLSDQSGFGLSVIDSGRNASGNNIGGLQQPFHRAEFSIPGFASLAPGESLELTLNYQLPMPTPTGWRIELAGEVYAFSQEYPQLPQLNELPGDPGNGDPGNGGPGEGCGGISPIHPWPQWPQTDWAGNPSHALGGDHLSYQGSVYRANWWTNSEPGSDGSWTFVCTL